MAYGKSTCVYVLSHRLFLQSVCRGWSLECRTCGADWLEHPETIIGQIVVSKKRASAQCARRDLDCAVNKNVVTCNIIEVA